MAGVLKSGPVAMLWMNGLVLKALTGTEKGAFDGPLAAWLRAYASSTCLIWVLVGANGYVARVARMQVLLDVLSVGLSVAWHVEGAASPDWSPHIVARPQSLLPHNERGAGAAATTNTQPVHVTGKQGKPWCGNNGTADRRVSGSHASQLCFLTPPVPCPRRGPGATGSRLHTTWAPPPAPAQAPGQQPPFNTIRLTGPGTGAASQARAQQHQRRLAASDPSRTGAAERAPLFTRREPPPPPPRAGENFWALTNQPTNVPQVRCLRFKQGGLPTPDDASAFGQSPWPVLLWLRIHLLRATNCHRIPPLTWPSTSDRSPGMPGKTDDVFGRLRSLTDGFLTSTRGPGWLVAHIESLGSMARQDARLTSFRSVPWLSRLVSTGGGNNLVATMWESSSGVSVCSLEPSSGDEERRPSREPRPPLTSKPRLAKGLSGLPFATASAPLAPASPASAVSRAERHRTAAHRIASHRIVASSVRVPPREWTRTGEREAPQLRVQVVTTQHTGRSPRPRNARTTRSTPTEDDPFRTELRRGALVHTRESSVRGFWKPARWHAADSTASVAPTPHHTTPVAVPIASIDTKVRRPFFSGQPQRGARDATRCRTWKQPRAKGSRCPSRTSHGAATVLLCFITNALCARLPESQHQAPGPVHSHAPEPRGPTTTLEPLPTTPPFPLFSRHLIQQGSQLPPISIPISSSISIPRLHRVAAPRDTETHAHTTFCSTQAAGPVDCTAPATTRALRLSPCCYLLTTTTLTQAALFFSASTRRIGRCERCSAAPELGCLPSFPSLSSPPTGQSPRLSRHLRRQPARPARTYLYLNTGDPRPPPPPSARATAPGRPAALTVRQCCAARRRSKPCGRPPPEVASRIGPAANSVRYSRLLRQALFVLPPPPHCSDLDRTSPRVRVCAPSPAMDVEMSSGDAAPQQSQPQTQSESPAKTSPPGASSASSAAAAQMSFRRQRASRACEVRCDAASLGVPCTNCVAFQIECRIPTPKRKKQSSTPGQNTKDSDSDREGFDDRQQQQQQPQPQQTTHAGAANAYPRAPTVSHTADGTPSSAMTESQVRQEEVDNNTYLNLVMKPKFTRAPITEAGRVAFLGESSNLTLLVHDRQGSSDVVHYPLPENVRGSRARLTELDNVEIDILHQRGAFLLPPRSLCDELIDAYFKWVHPIVPVINRTRFMRQYRDPKNPPSLLLLQAVLLAGSRVCTNAQLMDANGSTTPAALTFYKRAKALYDANYEDDRVTIVQSLLLLGWYWEGPEDVTKNVFYWSRVATIVAQGSGMHRSVEQSQLSKSDKRLWKRIWWTLFTRDRSVAVALGRPVHTNLDDSDVEMLTEDDFIEDETDHVSEYPPDPIHVQFFLQYVKLCEIMGLVLSQQYSVASKGRQRNAIDLTHSDMALADWLQNCPKIVYWEMPRHHFWSALLHSNYYTTLCLLHRAHMPPSGTSRFPDDSPYPSRNIAFQAAAMITSIVENLAAHGELRYCPAFIVYSLFSALIMHVYQMRSPVPSIQQVTQDRMRSCMQAMKEVSRVWLVGKMVYTLFESIIGNKVLEERLQKAGAKRHRRMQQSLSQLDNHSKAQDASKRKYDDMAIDFTANAPTPQESYERSRPQTPSAVKNEAPATMHQPSAASPNTRPSGADTFMGGTSSRPQTRPATPFNPSFSVPATPPDLYLVTRNSPNLSQSIWENFQPDQLFPESSSMPPVPNLSPTQTHQSLDQSLMAQMTPSSMTHSTHGQQGTQFQPRGSHGQGNGMVGMQGFQGQSGMWQSNFDGGVHDGQSPDSWSTGSVQGQPAPTTLNVEDWYEPVAVLFAIVLLIRINRFQFFGINGDASNLNLDVSLS
ncbi:transcriptional regulator family: Fungal Specific TF [Purpureocillium lilacinum]|uniref:Transcriptional regulator family: Fungal Specific TF n=1 Tax=Purpureocillium lilacinum TaxID=33203 RepID=A0ABR0BL81_PURLI|nr:transcriptional regulator family: Fungal Specific TF [Purpureocillium lilacinum]